MICFAWEDGLLIISGDLGIKSGYRDDSEHCVWFSNFDIVPTFAEH